MSDDDFDLGLSQETDATPDTSAASESGSAAPESDSSDGASAGQATPSQAQPTPAQSRAFYERARDLGFNFESDDQVVASLGQFRDYSAQAERWRQQLDAIAPHWSAFQNFLASQSAPAPAATKANPLDSWKQPEMPEGWEEYYAKDDNGRWVLDPSAPMHIKEAVDKFVKWRKEHTKRLDNLPTALREAGYMTQEDVQRMVEEQVRSLNQQVSSELAGRDLHATINQQMQALLPKFKDDKGKPTPFYNAFQKNAQELESHTDQHGNPIYSPQQVLAMAQRLAEADVLLQQQTLAAQQNKSNQNSGLPPAVSSPSNRTTPSQGTNPAREAPESIGDAITAHWGDISKDLFEGRLGQ